jgi:hypothetical protein
MITDPAPLSPSRKLVQWGDQSDRALSSRPEGAKLASKIWAIWGSSAKPHMDPIEVRLAQLELRVAWMCRRLGLSEDGVKPGPREMSFV